ncbi:EscU/YscU/HrcU family type III secretion system export apparatus switch protein [Solimicrobium silvestre]|uniref:Putative cytoplasmic domain of flagellar FhlB-like protein n=1 Tax=Solimicrobium silvestre TaxID=2099400 RepID=A0A2S9GSS6_9BURK|nr:EscU/YscU/HrcU family type III secretion system export apparatus switch protein [Solimicrobium silvestre]PRC90774.1 putative cytoplasmic domain of flagellar FhlB -like protein [Solimicrobium silvestre]
MNDASKPSDEATSSVQNAVALAYQAGSSAPTVVAKGKGLVAQAIIARAKEHGIYVHQSQELVALLMQVELDKNIPPALYRAVAELLAWLYHIEKQRDETTPVTPYITTAKDNLKIIP